MKVGETLTVRKNHLFTHKALRRTSSSLMKDTYKDKYGNVMRVGEKVELKNIRGENFIFYILEIYGNDMLLLETEEYYKWTGKTQ